MPIAATASRRFLALGDSYTIGEGVACDERWPHQLARRLRADGIAVGDAEIVATTGWTTGELAAAMDAQHFTPPYALVSLLIGVNNQYRGRPLDNYREEFVDLVARAVALAGARREHVIVVSIPDWGVTRFARSKGCDAARIAGEIDAFNAAARTIACDSGIAFVDITADSRAAGDADDLLGADGLHPSAVQYARWTTLIEPFARVALAAESSG
ncbi:MAG: SGNH/GDSL hydrolase family protein [Dokdonella sp.]